jgi:hypothetical protein
MIDIKIIQSLDWVFRVDYEVVYEGGIDCCKGRVPMVYPIDLKVAGLGYERRWSSSRLSVLPVSTRL